MHPRASDNPRKRQAQAGSHGAILLEVVLSLTLLMAGSAVVLGGLSASARRVARLRIEAHGQDLLATLVAEIQIGLMEAKDAGATQYEEPFADFSWEIVATDLPATEVNAPAMRQVTAIVRYTGQSGPKQVFRLNQWVAVAAAAAPGGGL